MNSHSAKRTINDIFARALTMANVPAIPELSGILQEDNKWMTNILRSHGCHLVRDYTCLDTLALHISMLLGVRRGWQ